MKYEWWRTALIVSTAVVALGYAPPAGAQTPFPLGPETLANAVTNGNQDQTAAAMDANGNFVVVWRDEFLDNSGSAIVGRRFSSQTGLPLTAQFVINQTTVGDQSRPAIAMNANGRFVVVWEGPDTTGPLTTGIFASLRAANGAAIVAEFPVNTTLAGTQQRPAVAIQNDGRFLITWQDDSGANLNDIVGRFYSANFPSIQPLAPVRLNTAVLGGEQEEPAVIAIAATGGWQVGWQGPTLPPVAAAVWVRVLDNTGSGQPEFPVNATFSTSPRTHLALSANALGNSVAVWQDAFANSVFARYLDLGVPTGIDEQINVSPDHLNREPAVALDEFGQYVIVWVEALGARSDALAPEGSPIVIQGRKKNSANRSPELFPPPTDTIFPVNSGGADFADPVILGRPHGSFVALWQGSDPADTSGFGIALRRFLDAPFADDFETQDTSRWSNVLP
jgi:hypothetical protein